MNGFIQEIINSLRNNVLRTVLTGMTIAWGIILLVVLLGVGDGVKKGVRQTISQVGADKVEMSITLNTTEEAYGGYRKDRQVEMTPEQFEYLRQMTSGDFTAMEPSYSTNVTLETDFGQSDVTYDTITEREQSFNKKQLRGGRLFTKEEHEKGARVCAIAEKDVSRLFPASMSALGQTLTVNGISYFIVGVVDYGNPFIGEILVPYNTAKSIYPNKFLKIRKVKLFPNTTDQARLKEMEEKVETLFRRTLRVSPDDRWAVRLESTTSMESGMGVVFTGLDILLWIMGIGSLSIGAIGVSNIMSVTVQERMREIGIRKALGARPRNILTMVLGESVFLSVVFGLVGLVSGYGVILLINFLAAKYEWATQIIPMGPSGSFMKVQVFTDPRVNITVAVGALVVLIIVGLLAGYSPARKAIKIPAVVAMRDNK